VYCMLWLHVSLDNSIVFHVISLLLLFNVTSLIFITIKRIIRCSSMLGITVLYRSHTTMYNYEENKRTRQNCV
jgi:hypothetical protein